MNRKEYLVNVFSDLKNNKIYNDKIELNLNNKFIAYLKPLQINYHELHFDIVSILSKWRIENPTISTGIFHVTNNRTKKWIENHILRREDRLFFMIYDLNENPLGHIGYSNVNYEKNSVELDSVLRGVKKKHKGLMSESVKTLIKFALEDLKFSDIELSVFSDNLNAVEFYKKLNFQKIDEIPLIKVIKKDEVKFETAPPGTELPVEKLYLKMRYKK